MDWGGGKGGAPFPLPRLLLGSLRLPIIIIIFFFSLFSPTAESGPRLLSWDNTQEKSLRHVAMEAKFLNDN